MTRIRNSEPRIMVGATATEDGVAGYAPTPTAGNETTEFLRKDGQYAVPAGGGGGGAVDSVNSQTGDVVLDTGDVDDVLDSRYVTDAQLAILALTTASFTTAQETKLAGIATGATANSSDAALLSRANHTGTQSADTLTDGVTNVAFLASERSKLAGIATAATANSADATLLARANHTGTQDADTITDGATNKAFLATERTKLAGIATGATANSSDATLLARANHTGTQDADTITDGTTNKAYTALEKTKLAGIATAATANSADATLLDRANHTGTQAQSTIVDLVTDLAAKAAIADFTVAKKRTVVFVIDGAGVAITTGTKGATIRFPWAGTITKATLLADQSGSIVIDVWKDTFANFPPTVADTITAAAKPTLSAATKAEDSTLTGWTTAVAAGDTLKINVDSAATITHATLILEITLT